MPETEKPAPGVLSNAGFIAWGLYGVLIIAGHPTAAVCVGLAVMIALVTREYRYGDVAEGLMCRFITTGSGYWMDW